MTLEERKKLFESMVSKHDLTYMYSDDSWCYRAGSSSYADIRLEARYLPNDFVISTWNSAVDHKLIESVREQFYWTEKDLLEKKI